MKEKIIDVISSVVKIDSSELLKHMDEEKQWNSLTHIELIITLESEFNITFEDEELMELTTVSKILKIVGKKVL